MRSDATFQGCHLYCQNEELFPCCGCVLFHPPCSPPPSIAGHPQTWALPCFSNVNSMGPPPHCRNTRNTAIDGKKKMQILIAALVAREEKGLKLEPSLLHPNSTGKMGMGPLEGFESRGQCASIAFHAQLCPQGTLYSTVSFPHEELSPAAIAALCCCLLLPCITVTICQTSPVANMSDTHIKKLLKPAGN